MITDPLNAIQSIAHLPIADGRIHYLLPPRLTFSHVANHSMEMVIDALESK